MSHVGWVQAKPRQKHHFMLKGSKYRGYWTACGMWGTNWINEDIIVNDPPQENKCKLCIRVLARSGDKP